MKQPTNCPTCTNGIVRESESNAGHTKCKSCREHDAKMDEEVRRIYAMDLANRRSK